MFDITSFAELLTEIKKTEPAKELMSVQTFKILMLVLMFLECYLGLCTARAGSTMKNQTPLSLLNCFSAGIFLAMSIMHILPEAREGFRLWGKYCMKIDEHNLYPLPFLLYTVGYVLILIIDRWLSVKYQMTESPPEVDITRAET